MNKIFEDICKKHGCCYANFYRIDPKHPSTMWAYPDKNCYYDNEKVKFFQNESQHFPFYLGVGLPGRVWETGKIEWQRNVQSLDRKMYPRRDLAIVAGIKACTGIPYEINGHVAGVIEFCFHEAKYEDEKFVKEIKKKFDFKGKNIDED